MIKRLKVHGYKSIREFDHTLTPLTVLVGPNDSGKTNLLEALRCLSKTARSPIDKVFQGEQSLNNVAWRGNKIPCVSWEAELEGFNASGGGQGYYVISVSQPGDELTLAIQKERVHYDGQIVFRADDSDNLKNGAGEVVVSATHRRYSALMEKKAKEQKGVAEMASWLGSVENFRFDPAVLAQPSPFNIELGETRLLNKGYGLPSVLAAIKLADSKRFEKIERALRAAVPAIDAIIIRPTNVTVPFGTAGEIDFVTGKEENTKQLKIEVSGHRLAFLSKGNKWEIPAEHTSAGVLLFLAYLTVVFSEHPPSVLLLEEPENGIHPRRLKTVLDLLRTLSQGTDGSTPATQVLLTTHSPYLLDFVSPEEILIFNKSQDGSTQVTPMKEVPQLQDRLSELTTGEMWFNIGEEVLASGGVRTAVTGKDQ